MCVERGRRRKGTKKLIVKLFSSLQKLKWKRILIYSAKLQYWLSKNIWILNTRILIEKFIIFKQKNFIIPEQFSYELHSVRLMWNKKNDTKKLENIDNNSTPHTNNLREWMEEQQNIFHQYLKLCYFLHVYHTKAITPPPSRM